MVLNSVDFNGPLYLDGTLYLYLIRFGREFLFAPDPVNPW